MLESRARAAVGIHTRKRLFQRGNSLLLRASSIAARGSSSYCTVLHLPDFAVGHEMLSFPLLKMQVDHKQTARVVFCHIHLPFPKPFTSQNSKPSTYPFLESHAMPFFFPKPLYKQPAPQHKSWWHPRTLPECLWWDSSCRMNSGIWHLILCPVIKAHCCDTSCT